MELSLTTYKQLLSLQNNTIDIELNNNLIVGYYNSLNDLLDTSKETYKTTARHFIEWLNDRPINESTITDYKGYLISRYQGGAINIHISGMNKFLSYLSKKGYIDYSKDIKQRKETSTNRSCLTLEQVRSLFAQNDVNTLQGVRDNALIKLLILGGFRVCEIERATIHDLVQVGSNTALKVQGKGKTSKSDYVLLSSECVNALEQYLYAVKKIRKSDALFISLSDKNKGQALSNRAIRNAVNLMYQNAGILDNNISTHSTRHTAITLALMSGKTLQETKDFARHSNINTTLIYAHNLNKMSNNVSNSIEALINQN